MPENHEPPKAIVPEGTLHRVSIENILPSENNPRHLFDEAPLQALKDSIRTHGVLVPLTIHRKKGTDKYHIIDGERRYKCCQLLADEGIERARTVPANIVDTPDKLAALLYMFSIHNFREGWELMPTALGLKEVMEQLGEEQTDTRRLRELTGLSEPQIERCKILLSFPEEFQLMSLATDPIVRIPSNFWIEAKPVLDAIAIYLPDEEAAYGGRDGLTYRLVEKYRARAIKSVIHFRRVMDAIDLTWRAQDRPEDDDRTERTSKRIHEWLRDIRYDTRAAFDELIVDERRVRKAIETCADFKRAMERLRLDYEIDRDELRIALDDVRTYIDNLLETLKGEDPPELDANGVDS